MKTKMRLLSQISLVLISVLLVTSCNDNTENPIEASLVEIAEDDSYADATFEDIDATVEETVAGLEDANYVVSSLKSAGNEPETRCSYEDTTTFPKTVVIDFGDGIDYILPNGDTITKSGKIIIEITDRFWKVGAKRIVTFEDFYVNGVKVEGERTIENISDYENDILKVEITLEGGKLIVNDTLQYTRDSKRTRQWLRERYPMNDTLIVRIEYANGVNFRGLDYHRETLEDLVLIRCVEYGRRWTIVDGIIIGNVGDKDLTLDYGNGSCDRWVTLTDGEGNQRQFRYHHGKRYRHQVRNQ